MKKSSKGKLVNSATYPNGSTIGLDVSDDYIYAAVIDGNGTLLISANWRTKRLPVPRAGFRRDPRASFLAFSITGEIRSITCGTIRSA